MQRLGVAVIAYALALSAGLPAYGQYTVHEAWRNDIQGVRGAFAPQVKVRVRMSGPCPDPGNVLVVLQVRRLGSPIWHSETWLETADILNKTYSCSSPSPIDDWYFGLEWRLMVFPSSEDVGYEDSGTLGIAHPVQMGPWAGEDDCKSLLLPFDNP